MKNYMVSDVLHYCNVSLDRCSSMPRKKIDFYDLTFVLSGEMVYTADDRTYTLKKNDAVFLRPGTMRSRAPGTGPVEYVSFNFQLRDGEDLPFPPYLHGCISKNIKRLVAVFPQSHLSCYYHAEEKLANMLNYILFELLDVAALQSTNEHIFRITRYIDEHITQTMSLQTISREVGLSKEYTSFIFKKEIGQTLTDYINQRKMLMAKELILKNEMSLADLSVYLGYNNYNYFSRLFKRYFDITPVKLRKRA